MKESKQTLEELFSDPELGGRSERITLQQTGLIRERESL
jgi:hypothetical protein